MARHSQHTHTYAFFYECFYFRAFRSEKCIHKVNILTSVRLCGSCKYLDIMFFSCLLVLPFFLSSSHFSWKRIDSNKNVYLRHSRRHEAWAWLWAHLCVGIPINAVTVTTITLRKITQRKFAESKLMALLRRGQHDRTPGLISSCYRPSIDSKWFLRMVLCCALILVFSILRHFVIKMLYFVNKISILGWRMSAMWVVRFVALFVRLSIFAFHIQCKSKQPIKRNITIWYFSYCLVFSWYGTSCFIAKSLIKSNKNTSNCACEIDCGLLMHRMNRAAEKRIIIFRPDDKCGFSALHCSSIDWSRFDILNASIVDGFTDN